VTEVVQDGLFLIDEVAEMEYLARFKRAPDRIFDATMLWFILGLRDCHRHNFCLTPASQTGPEEFPLRIVDFLPPEAAEPAEYYADFSDSPGESLRMWNYSACQAGLARAMAKLGDLDPPDFRFAVYPKPAHGQDFLSLADSAQRDARLPKIQSCQDFLMAVEVQLRESLLGEGMRINMTGFTGRSLGQLFGLTDTTRVWQGPDFDRATARASADPAVNTFDPFFESVCRAMTGNAPPTIAPGRANKSVNYALTMLRWYGIWIGRRIENMQAFFVEKLKSLADQ
jgi:hypothetical protein